MPIRNAMDLIKLMMAYTGQRKDTARRNKSEVWRSVRNEKKQNISNNMFYNIISFLHQCYIKF
ncbi:hypothetical protein DXD09_09525 [Ligilactobacillus ruminis]|uniref:Uncharacterized protein n=1 Tax=Ligilactobacillus ruminis TaxID=1623 RepID=A0A8B2Z2D6_9LACO|nr:hypothetical protein DXD09_09525 [Ligilactobacillus ruminis]